MYTDDITGGAARCPQRMQGCLGSRATQVNYRPIYSSTSTHQHHPHIVTAATHGVVVVVVVVNMAAVVIVVVMVVVVINMAAVVMVVIVVVVVVLLLVHAGTERRGGVRRERAGKHRHTERGCLSSEAVLFHISPSFLATSPMVRPGVSPLILGRKSPQKMKNADLPVGGEIT
ncbi:hypothetical protein CRUP_016432 [Coryphaenoides rupestris]|nr:hypothetical protein CRUP_016432 [Coryphaenoides rupestris]